MVLSRWFRLFTAVLPLLLHTKSSEQLFTCDAYIVGGIIPRTKDKISPFTSIGPRINSNSGGGNKISTLYSWNRRGCTIGSFQNQFNHHGHVSTDGIRFASGYNTARQRKGDVHFGLYSKQSENDEEAQSFPNKSNEEADHKTKDEDDLISTTISTVPPATTKPKQASESLSYQLFKVFSYIIQFLGLYFTFGILLNILGYGYSFDLQNGFQVDKIQNIRNERQFQRELDRISPRSSGSIISTSTGSSSGSTDSVLEGSSFVEELKTEE